MAIPIQLRRNGTAASTPSSLLHGEVALNYADGKLFWKDASNVIQSFTFQAYALSSHTHAASDIVSGTLDAARLPLATTGAAGAIIVGTGLGVSSGTVSVTYGTSAGTACQGNDARLSDTRTPTDGSVTTAKIANDAVTYAKLQNVSADDRLLGRSSAGAGDVEEIVCTSFGRALLDDTSHAAQLTTLGAAPLASPTFTGTVTVPGLTATAAILADDLSSDNSVVYSFDGDPNSGIGRAGADILTLVTNGSERVRVGSGGGVGIGTTTTTDALNVVGVTTHYQSSNGTPALGSKQYYSACFENASAGYGLALGGVQGGNGAAYLQVQSFSSAVAYPMYLQALGGEVLVGGTGDNGGYNLQCNGTGVWGAGAYVNGSDARIKDDITPLGEATSAIESMQPVTFRYKPTWSSDQSIQPGFVAQQLQEALAGTPYLHGVVQQGTEYLSVAYQSLIPLLVKALQESNARIAALEERINA